MKTNNRAIGTKAENLVADKLINDGYEILKRNYYSKYGEIDIIAVENNVLAFIEVKYRRTNKFGMPREFVTRTKQQRLIKTAMCYLMDNTTEYDGIRFDVVEVFGDLSINVIKCAFIEE